MTYPKPSFFNPANAEDWSYVPNLQKVQREAFEFQKKNNVKPSSTDTFRTHLLLIDVQRDFCHTEGTLFVGGRSGDGAIEDSKRIAEFIYRNIEHITETTVTLDTHFAFQIFSAPFWRGPNGEELEPHTLIVEGDDGNLVNTGLDGSVIHRGVVPNPAMSSWLSGSNYPWLLKQVRHYVRELKKEGKYTLYLWPPHCILGSPGHALVGVVDEARLFHGWVRGTQPNAEVKGTYPLTENYSVLGPEVLTRWDSKPYVEKNVRFIDKLLNYDAVIIAGQAASHCVKSTIDDLLTEIKAQDPALARKVYIVEDCMSAVVVPGADFTDDAEAALDRYRDAGMHVVKSTEAIENWPEIALKASA